MDLKHLKIPTESDGKGKGKMVGCICFSARQRVRCVCAGVTIRAKVGLFFVPCVKGKEHICSTGCVVKVIWPK